MDFRRDESTRTVRTPAKLNLYLDVLSRRDDNYHELETLMVPVAIWDSLFLAAIPPSDGGLGEIILDVRQASPVRPPPGQVDGLLNSDVPQGKDNLVVRALELLRERSGCRAGARLTLVKRIPVAAGLGGGSSDAAAALQLGNRVWRLGWSTQRLAELGAELGSDVPFFTYRRSALCRGRGERVTPLGPIRRFHAVIVKPPFGLRTPEVFRAHDARESMAVVGSARLIRSERLSSAISALRRGDWAALGQSLTNRLEAAAASMAPWIEQVRAVFARLTFVGHQLSGSGSAYFGICSHAAHAQRLAATLRTRQLGRVYAVSSCT